MNEISALLRSLQAQLHGQIVLAGHPIARQPPQIHMQEWQLVAAAGEKRQREFACGRLLAHRLLEQLGASTEVIDRDEKGCPQWPPDIVGSISHTDRYCVAVAASQTDCRAIGIDLEKIERMQRSLWPKLFTAQETGHLREYTDDFAQARHAAILFSAKEALYKCDYPLNRRWVDFDDVSVTVSQGSGRLSIRSMDDRKNLNYEGCFAATRTHVACVVYSLAARHEYDGIY